MVQRTGTPQQRPLLREVADQSCRQPLRVLRQHQLVQDILQGLHHRTPAQPLDYGRNGQGVVLRVGPFLPSGRYLQRRRRTLQPVQRIGQRHRAGDQMAPRRKHHLVHEPFFAPADADHGRTVVHGDPDAHDEPPGLPDDARKEPRRNLDRRGRLHGLGRIRRREHVARRRQVRPEQQNEIHPRFHQGRAGRRDRRQLLSQPHRAPHARRALHLLHGARKFGRTSRDLVVRGALLQPRTRGQQRRADVDAETGRKPLAQTHGRLEHREHGLHLHAGAEYGCHRSRAPQSEPYRRRTAQGAGQRQLLGQPRGHLLPRELRLQGKIPRRGERPLRRQLEIPEQPALGLLPLGVGRLAYFGGALHGRSQKLARQPENPRLVRFYRQRPGRQLPLPEQDRDQEESRIPDGRQPADLRRQTVAHPRRPDVGDGQHLRPGSGLGDAQRPAVDRGGHLPQEHDRHVRRRPRTSRRIR